MERAAKAKEFEEKVGEIDWQQAGLKGAFNFLAKIDGSATTGEKKHVILQNDRVFLKDDEKSRIFCEHYTNGNPCLDSERTAEIGRQNKAKLPTKAGDITICTHEVLCALRCAKMFAACGLDSISGAHLKNLPPPGVEMLRGLMEFSVNSGSCALNWRKNCILPTHKNGKCTYDVKSYRPLCLTSCLCKIVERVVLARFIRFAPSHPWQLGYKKHRSCGDSVGILVAEAERATANGNGLATLFLDLSAAFDRVPIELAIAAALDAPDVPVEHMSEYLTCVRWLNGFLHGRRNHVRCGDFLSEPLTSKQGLPQGTVLGPQLWSVFANRLLKELQRRGFSALMYADDICIYFEFSDKAWAEVKMQEAIDAVQEWCYNNNQELSFDKSVYTIFGQQANETFDLFKNDMKIRKDQSPRFLGIVFDSQLTFNKQLDITINKCRRRLQAVRKLRHATWAPSGRHIKMLYVALVESVLTYCAAAWYPRLSEVQLNKIDAFQAEAANVISGALSSTGRSVSINIAELLPCREIMSREAAIMYVRGFTRQDCQDPLYLAVRSGKSSWRQVGEHTCMEAGVFWENVDLEWSPFVDKSVDIHRFLGRNLQIIFDEIPPAEVDLAADVVLYTDGSAKHARGSCAVAEFGGEGGGVIVDVEKLRVVADSFTAEQRGIQIAVEHVENTAVRGKSYAILTDSLSNLMSLKSAGPRDRTEYGILQSLVRICEAGNRITLRFVRAHKDTPGNEFVDSLASHAIEPSGFVPYVFRPIALNLAKTRIVRQSKKSATDKLFDSDLQGALWFRQNTGLEQNPTLKNKRSGGLFCTRSEEILYNQFRCGCLWGLRGPRENRDECPKCGVADSTSHALFDCPFGARPRMELKRSFEQETATRVEENKKARCEEAKHKILKWGDPMILQLHPDASACFLGSLGSWLDGFLVAAEQEGID